ncbi:MAG: hypothetical protein ABIU54_10615 [Candidatus Eisenbacteria bacterium]
MSLAPAMSAAPALRAVRLRMVVSWVVAFAFGAGMFQVAAWSARALPRPSSFEELAYYPSGEHLERVTFGHRESAADLAWLRAVQYYGAHRVTDNRFYHLEHVFDILTSLAPHFRSPYVFGAFSLAQEGSNFPAAERLLLKGVENNPADPYLVLELAFLYYVKPGGRDLERAAEYFERSARLPGGYAVGRRFAAYCRQHAGDLSVSYALWSQVKETSDNAYLREIADKEMKRIHAAIVTGRKELAVQKLSTPIVILGHGQ